MALKHFYFNNKSSGQFGLLVNDVRVYGAPNRKVDRLSVSGRNGDIIVELGGFENYIVQYEVSIIKGFKINAREIINWLLSSKGYIRLTDDFEPNYYRMASMYSGIDFDITSFAREGKGTIQFDCMPQRFLLDGETITTLTTSGTIENPYQMASKPLVRVYGTGTLTIGNYQVKVLECDEYVDINSETQQAYEGTANRNNQVEIEEFPLLVSGENTITLGSGITKVEITPNWWVL